MIFQCLIYGMVYFALSTCLVEWITMKICSIIQTQKIMIDWILSFKDALAFRTSHYFISHVAMATLMSAGSVNKTKIVEPRIVEAPISLKEVIISWNIPMHRWLKKCKFFLSILPYFRN